MKKSLLITTFLILIPLISVHGQETDSLSSHSNFNTFFDARIGLAYQGSLNLERLWYKNKNALLLNTGIGFTTIVYEGKYTGLSFPLTTTVLLGSSPYDQRYKHLEINVGLNIVLEKIPSGTQIWPFPRATIGYRYQNPQTGKIFRIYGGFLSIGMSFNL